MNTKKVYEILKNSKVYEVNRMNACSDHSYKIFDENLVVDSTLSLDGTWQMKYYEDLNQRNDKFYEVDDKSEYDFFTVPGQLEVNGYGKPKYVNTQYPWDGIEDIKNNQIPSVIATAQFVKYVTIDSSWKNKNIIIKLHGVEVAFNLWCNGEYVGYSEDSFTPSSFDLTKFICCEEPVKIAIEIYKYSSASWLEDQDFWRMFGINRSIELMCYNPLHISNIHVKSTLMNDYCDAIINVDTTVFSMNQNYYLNYIVNDLEGNFIYRTTENNFIMKNVMLWSGEKPNLYDLTVEVFNENNTKVEEVYVRFGIREFKIIDKVMCLNGKRILLNGINRHDFSQDKGRVVSKEQMHWDIEFMKRNNINAVRTSHYPSDSYFYKLCDEYGIYVIDETNLETHGTFSFSNYDPTNDFILPGDNINFRDAVLDRGKSMMYRDFNHPSVLFWSCGNESMGGKTLYEMSNLFRDYDDTRLVHYEGVCLDRRFNDTSDVEGRMYTSIEEIKEFLDNDPQKPYILSEYSHAMGNSNGDMRVYQNLQEQYLQYQGGFIWEMFEHGLLNDNIVSYGGDFGDRPTDYNFVIDGIVAPNRTETQKVSEVKKIFQPIIMKLKNEKLVIKNNFLFTNLNEFTIYMYKIENEKKVLINTLTLDIGPSCTKELSINTKNMDILEISIVNDKHIHPNKWINEIAFEQFQINNYNNSFKLYNDKFRVVNGDGNVGIYGDGFSIMFGKVYGRIISIVYDGVEYLKNIENSFRPNFWRALTNNDFAAFKQSEFAFFKTASLYNKVIDTKYTFKDDCVIIECMTTLDFENKYVVTTKYTINTIGEILVEYTYPGFDGLPNMFKVGLDLEIPKEFNDVEWYGRGPDDTHSDRYEGNKKGLFKLKVDSQKKYIIPQDYGYKTSVDWFSVSNQFGKGLMIRGLSSFEFSALNHTCHEIELASHDYELANPSKVVLNLSCVSAGVGGDDSWGRWTHKEFHVDSKQSYKLGIIISKL